MSTLKLGQIDEDEYFGRVLYDELVAILKNIKTEHRKDKSTSDGSMIDNLMKELEDAQTLQVSVHPPVPSSGYRSLNHPKWSCPCGVPS